MAGGRPSKLTMELQQKICTLVEAGHFPSVAAMAVGVGESTFYRWKEKGRKAKRGRYREFIDALAMSESTAEIRHLEKLRKSEDPRWSAWWLERRYAGRYGPKVKTELTGRDGGPVAVAGGVTVYIPDNGRGDR